MKNLKIQLSGAVALILLVSSCKKVIFEAGDLTTENRTITETYDEIHIEGSIDVYVGQYSEDVTIEAGENIIPHIKTYTQDQTLYIKEESNNYLTAKPRRVYVNASILDRIRAKGAGDVEAENLVSDTFTLDMDGSGDAEVTFSQVSSVVLDLGGSGDAKFSGTGNSMYIGVNGSGDVNAKNFLANTAVVNVNGSGDVDVYAENNLTININGSGDVSYWGNPADTNFNTNGSGDINQIN